MGVYRFVLMFSLLVSFSVLFSSGKDKNYRGFIVRDARGDCRSCNKDAWLDMHEKCLSCTHKNGSEEVLPPGVTAISINEPSLACQEVRDRAAKEISKKKHKNNKDGEVNCFDIASDCFKKRN